MLNSIGFMQGRLSPLVNGKIQSFPWKHWQSEFLIANQIGLDLMEWTLDHKNLYQNPIMHRKGQNLINQLKYKHSLKIETLTGDCFMQFPFWKSTGKKSRKSKIRFLKYSSSL